MLILRRTMAGGVDHLWGTPWLVGWTTARGVDHLWGTPWLVGYTMASGVDHGSWGGPFVAGGVDHGSGEGVDQGWRYGCLCDVVKASILRMSNRCVRTARVL